MLSKEELGESVFKELDLNSDGQVTADEFVRAYDLYKRLQHEDRYIPDCNDTVHEYQLLQNFSRVALTDLCGNYERTPIENDWHQVTVTLEGGKVRWSTKAGPSWVLDVAKLAENGSLSSGSDCPYVSRGGLTHFAEISEGTIHGR